MEEFIISFLDVGPVIRALRSRPADFVMERGWLHHLPSAHRFQVDQEGNVRIDACCDCALLHVKREQGRELWNAFEIWQSAHWRPTEINGEFAKHFRPPNMWGQLYRGFLAKLRQAFHRNGQPPTAGECHV